MARRPGFEVGEGDSLVVNRVKTILKESSPETRAHILKWLVKYYGDGGDLFSPALSKLQREQVTIGGQTFWLVRASKK